MIRSLVLALTMMTAAQGWAQSPLPDNGDAAPDAAPSVQSLEASPDQNTERSEPRLQTGDTYIRAEFEDWQFRCTLLSGGDELCHMFQLLRDENENPVASLRIAPLTGAQGRAVAAAEITAPLETLLLRGVEIKVDARAPKTYQFAYCTTLGCHARIGFSEQDIAAFRRGINATITLTAFTAPDTPIQLNASLRGFTAAYRALQNE